MQLWGGGVNHGRPHLRLAPRTIWFHHGFWDPRTVEKQNGVAPQITFDPHLAHIFLIKLFALNFFVHYLAVFRDCTKGFRVSGFKRQVELC